MGGDGGVIASNRKYMRGAGTADHTGDASRRNHNSEKESDKQVMRELMGSCYLTKQPLLFSPNADVVVDPYGRLYNKEAAVEALLRRSSMNSDELGSHVRGLKDLKTLTFALSSDKKPICPVTSVELNGLNPAYYIPCPTTKDDGGNTTASTTTPNVLSERAIKEMGKEALKQEFGDLDESTMIRLAPPPSMFQEIQERVREQQEKDQLAKKDKKGKKNKRKKEDGRDKKKRKIQQASTSTGVTGAARQRVQSAVKGNDVLSSLFTNNDTQISEKQRTDNLFALNT